MADLGVLVRSAADPKEEERGLTRGWPERIDPELDSSGIVAHHLKKYEFARSFAKGIFVDVACGVGYGTRHAATKARLAIGIDKDRGAIGIARERYEGKGVVFLRGDAMALPLRDSMANSLTCFEGIEHFANPLVHLCEVTRVLRNDGVYLLSTPRKGSGSEKSQSPANPYHVQEFTPNELWNLVRCRFLEVKLLGQRRLQTRGHRAAQRLDFLRLRRLGAVRPIARPVSRRLGTPAVEEATIDDFAIDDDVENALDLLALCRAPVPQ